MNARIVVYRDLLTVCLENEPNLEEADGIWVVTEAKNCVRISRRAVAEIAAHNADVNPTVVLNLCEDTLVWCGGPVTILSSDMVYTDGLDGYEEVDDDLPEWAKIVVDEQIDEVDAILDMSDEEALDDVYGDPQHATVDDD